MTCFIRNRKHYYGFWDNNSGFPLAFKWRWENGCIGIEEDVSFSFVIASLGVLKAMTCMIYIAYLVIRPRYTNVISFVRFASRIPQFASCVSP